MFESSKEKPLISVIIPCFNDAEYIEEAIDSVINQSWDNLEVIVIDDGSNSRTKEIINELYKKIDTLITQENKGVSTARNKGIQAATGEYILILDSDDFFEPTFCEKAFGILEKEKQIKLVTCYSNWFGSKLGSKIFKPRGGTLEEVLINNVAMGSAMIKKEDWAKAGGYDENMLTGYEDWEFYIRLLKDGGSVYVIPEVLFHYRNKPGSRNKKANLKKYELLEYIYLKHADLYKEHFEYFISEWLDSVKKSEAFKQQVMNSIDYKVGYKILKPFRFLGWFKKK